VTIDPPTGPQLAAIVGLKIDAWDAMPDVQPLDCDDATRVGQLARYRTLVEVCEILGIGGEGPAVQDGVIGQGRVDLLDRIARYVRRDGRHAGPYLSDWINVALHGDAAAMRELDRRMGEKRA
jgi:hypothetical protein